MHQHINSNFNSKYYRFFLPAILILILLCIASALWFDKQAGLYILPRHEVDLWKTIRLALAPLGKGAFQAGLLLIFTAACFISRHKTGVKLCGRLLLAFLISLVIVTALKHTFLRPRPNIPREPLPAYSMRLHASDWHSFPSGDVAVTVAMTVFLFIIFRTRRSIGLIWLWPVLVSIQRYIAARHYPSDILTGWVLGFLTAWIILQFIPLQIPVLEKRVEDDSPRAIPCLDDGRDCG